MVKVLPLSAERLSYNLYNKDRVTTLQLIVLLATSQLISYHPLMLSLANKGVADTLDHAHYSSQYCICCIIQRVWSMNMTLNDVIF